MERNKIKTSNEKRIQVLYREITIVGKSIINSLNVEGLHFIEKKTGNLGIINDIEGTIIKTGIEYSLIFFKKKGFMNLGKDIYYKVRLGINHANLDEINVDYYNETHYQQFRKLLMKFLEHYHLGLKGVKLKEKTHFEK